MGAPPPPGAAQLKRHFRPELLYGNPKTLGKGTTALGSGARFLFFEFYEIVKNKIKRYR